MRLCCCVLRVGLAKDHWQKATQTTCLLLFCALGVQTHDFLNNAGSKKGGEARSDALGLDFGLEWFLTVESQRKPQESGSAQRAGGYHTPLRRMGRQVKPLAGVCTFIWHPAEQRQHLI